MQRVCFNCNKPISDGFFCSYDCKQGQLYDDIFVTLGRKKLTRKRKQENYLKNKCRWCGRIFPVKEYGQMFCDFSHQMNYRNGVKPMTKLYICREIPDEGFVISKIGDYDDEIARYKVSKRECSCPSGNRPTCKHRSMLDFFLHYKHVNDGWLLNWDNRQWTEPFLTPEPSPKANGVDAEADACGSSAGSAREGGVESPTPSPSHQSFKYRSIR